MRKAHYPLGIWSTISVAMAGPSFRYILHADLDAFYASVEQRDNPELKGKSVAVGGPPESRGVVAAASYEARRYGIHSAMPMRTAMKLCDKLVRVSLRFGRYHEVSRQVMGIFLGVTHLVQPLSLDEAYLDITSQVAPEDVDRVAAELKSRVFQETELAVTIGGGTSKTVAKIASQVAKPDGLVLVKEGDEQAFLAPLDVDMLWGVGPKTAEALKKHGISTIGHLAACDEGWLKLNFGKRGPEMRSRAVGIDNQQVTPHQDTKSVSAETTMPVDVDKEVVLLEQMERLSQGVAIRLGKEGLKGKTVSVKLRLADFTTFTRQRTLPAPTDEVDTICRAASELLRRELSPGRRFRLIGVGVSNFRDDYQLSLLTPA